MLRYLRLAALPSLFAIVLLVGCGPKKTQPYEPPDGALGSESPDGSEPEVNEDGGP